MTSSARADAPELSLVRDERHPLRSLGIGRVPLTHAIHAPAGAAGPGTSHMGRKRIWGPPARNRGAGSIDIIRSPICRIFLMRVAMPDGRRNVVWHATLCCAPGTRRNRYRKPAANLSGRVRRVHTDRATVSIRSRNCFARELAGGAAQPGRRAPRGSQHPSYRYRAMRPAQSPEPPCVSARWALQQQRAGSRRAWSGRA